MPIRNNAIQKNDKMPRILCIFTKVLGGKTFSEALESVLHTTEGLDYKVISYQHSDYKDYPTPVLLRYSNSLDSAWRIFRKVQNVLNKWEYDTLLFSSYHLMIPFLFKIKKKKTYLALDTTPSLAIRLSAKRSSKIKRTIAEAKAIVSKVIFKQYFRHVDVFLPRTEWCASSLISEYGVKRENIVVTYMPIEAPRETENPRKLEDSDKLSLLFVGNDFERKGGNFLLDMYNQYLRESCELTILSSEDASKYTIPVGVRWINGCNKSTSPSIYDYYREADLFIFPTWNEQLGLVLCEAISMGLPVIARNVGGISELVEDSYNGYLQSFESSIDQWAKKIMSLAADRDRLKYFSSNSNFIAVSKLSWEDFEETIKNKLF